MDDQQSPDVNKSASSDLLDCPFCGNKPTVSSPWTNYYITCSYEMCPVGMKTKPFKCAKSARIAWNTRAI